MFLRSGPDVSPLVVLPGVYGVGHLTPRSLVRSEPCLRTFYCRLLVSCPCPTRVLSFRGTGRVTTIHVRLTSVSLYGKTSGSTAPSVPFCGSGQRPNTQKFLGNIDLFSHVTPRPSPTPTPPLDPQGLPQIRRGGLPPPRPRGVRPCISRGRVLHAVCLWDPDWSPVSPGQCTSFCPRGGSVPLDVLGSVHRTHLAYLFPERPSPVVALTRFAHSSTSVTPVGGGPGLLGRPGRHSVVQWEGFGRQRA